MLSWVHDMSCELLSWDLPNASGRGAPALQGERIPSTPCWRSHLAGAQTMPTERNHQLQPGWQGSLASPRHDVLILAAEPFKSDRLQ